MTIPKIFRTILLIVVCFCSNTMAQTAVTIREAKANPDTSAIPDFVYGKLPRYAVFGIGSIASGETNKPDLPSARFAIEWNPHAVTYTKANLPKNNQWKKLTRVNLMASFGKGAGLRSIESDVDSITTLDKTSLVFPEASNTAFLLSGELTPFTRMQDQGKSFSDIATIFAECFWHSYSAVDGTTDKSFNASSFNFGIRPFAFTGAIGNAKVAMTTSAFYCRLAVSDADKTDYREMFVEPMLDTDFDGYGVRVTGEISNFIFEFEHKNYKRKHDNDTGDGIIDGQFTIKLAIRGLIFKAD